MSESSPPASDRPAVTDSPWFWVMLFSAVACGLLLAMGPRYNARQRRLEMQYMAHEEVLRRQAEDETPAREQGQEGETPPPALGDLLVPVWPLVIVFAGLFAASATLLRRSQKLSAHGVPPGTAPP